MAIRSKSHTAGEITLRHLWLAGLGVASLLRRDALDAGGRLFAQAARLQRRARGAARRAGPGLAAAVRRHVDPANTSFDDGIGARFAPLMRRLVLRPRAVRTPAAEEPAHRAALRRILRRRVVRS